jgi:glutamyl-tRNA(Gln) amidotransferase subunit E
VPLVEIATEPFEVSPKQIKKIALALGRILRSTKKVKRGLGSIRQDVNVSIKGGGVVIEVKGVQQLDQLEKVVEYEAKRQYGLLQISKELKDKGYVNDKNERVNVTDEAKGWNSKIIKSAIENKHEIDLIVFKNLAGIFGKSPLPGIRLGKDIAELVRFFGLGGIFHSDELPNYGIQQSDVDNLRKNHNIGDNDAFLLLATPTEKADIVIDQILLRMQEIRDNGIPKDTRLATQSGETKFLRPRPGAARMYPETDIPSINITKKELEEAEKNIPKSWDESIKELQTKYEINSQLTEQIFDSKYIELFEKIVEKTKVSPTFVASVLCSTITNLERSGLNSNLLKDEHILESFQLLDVGKIVKESFEKIFENIMSGKSNSVEKALEHASIEAIDKSELENICYQIVEDNQEIINNQKERAIGPLMGIAMKKLRGKASGEAINNLLLKNIKKKLENI